MVSFNGVLKKLGFLFYYLKPGSINDRVVRYLDRTKKDDYNWDNYTTMYKSELRSIKGKHTQILKDNDYQFVDQKLVKTNQDILPLHVNHRLLYETILQLSPNSILEIGCGGGDHLANNILLNKEIVPYGTDISSNQISLLHDRHPNLKAWTSVSDSKELLPNYFPMVDLAYTQAVIMHIHKNDGHLIALQNIFSKAKKHVILMENWNTHNFVEDIKNLHKANLIKWPELYLYFRRSPELNNKPYILIASSLKINEYEILNDDSTLKHPIKKE